MNSENNFYLLMKPVSGKKSSVGSEGMPLKIITVMSQFYFMGSNKNNPTSKKPGNKISALELFSPLSFMDFLKWF